MIKGKKGNFRDIPEYMNFAIVFGILVFFGGTIIYMMNENISSNSAIDEQAKAGSASLFDGFTTFHDYAFPILYLLFLTLRLESAKAFDILRDASGFSVIITTVILSLYN